MGHYLERFVTKSATDSMQHTHIYIAFFISNNYYNIFKGDVWICMELMDKSLDKLYQLVYKKLNEKIPEVIVGKMADSVSKGNEWADKPSQQILYVTLK